MLQLTEGNNVLQYRLLLSENVPGHGSLLWCWRARSVKVELVEVFPDGYRLWGIHFRRLASMIEWFKETGMVNSSKCRRDFKEEDRDKGLEAFRALEGMRDSVESWRNSRFDGESRDLM